MPQMSKVSSKFGAPMGRWTAIGEPGLSYKFRVFRVNLDSGGYDDGGAYWGIGLPLYCIQSNCGNVECYWRANNRENAKKKVSFAYPKAKFFR